MSDFQTRATEEQVDDELKSASLSVVPVCLSRNLKSDLPPW